MNVREAEGKILEAGRYVGDAVRVLSDLHLQIQGEIKTVDPSSEFGRAFDELSLGVVRAQTQLCTVLSNMPDDVFGRLQESQPVQERAPARSFAEPLIASGV